MNRAWVLVLCAAACSHALPVDDLEAHPATAVETPGGEAAAPERELARAAHAELERQDPEAGPPAAAELARRHGGWVASMAARSVTVEVPGDQLDAVLLELPSLGKVTARHLAARDLTAAHRDLAVRIDNLRRERERYLALLERAATVADATAVEREIERLTTQLELLEARLQAMTGKIQDAEVRLDFSRETKPGPVGYLFYWAYSGVKWLFVRD
jgi:hypothetical protein